MDESITAKPEVNLEVQIAQQEQNDPYAQIDMSWTSLPFEEKLASKVCSFRKQIISETRILT